MQKNSPSSVRNQSCKSQCFLTIFWAILALTGSFAGAAQTKDTKFTANRGFYTNAFTLVVSSGTPGATVTLTLDGSDPRVSSNGITGLTPLSIPIDPSSRYEGKRPRLTSAVTIRAYASSTGNSPTEVDTHTYIFPQHVRSQPNVVPEGAYVFWDTVMDPRVVNDPRYSGQISNALQDLPTLSIVMNWEDLFGTSGIHRGNNLNNHSLEKACSAELIYPATEKFAAFQGFQENCGIKAQGGGGRWDEGLYAPKQSFTLMFQPNFGGPGRLKYPLFEAAPVNSETDAREYNRIILRAGHNKSWAGPGPNLRETVVYTRDEYSRASLLALSGKGGSAHGTFVHLYLNGLYWGLYNPAERPDHAFQSIYFGGDGEHYDSYKERNGDPNGDRTRLTAAQNLASKPTTPYATIKQFVDTAQLADFMLVTWASGAADGPQWYAGNARNPGGPIRFFPWDYEDSFTPPGTGRGGAGYTWTDANPLWTFIRSHPEFKMELADRAYKHCFNDGQFTDAANLARWRALTDYIEQAVIGESARWGDQPQSSQGTPDISGYRPPLNRDDHWYKARDQVATLLTGNTARLIAGLRSHGFFPTANARAPLFLENGTNEIRVSRIVFTNSIAIKIARDGNTGTVLWTANGGDPRAEGGAEQGLNGGTGTNMVITTTTTLKARARYGTEWSPLHVLTVHSAAEDLSPLRITEIMYHPRGTEVAANRPITQIIGDAGGADSGRAIVRLASNAPGGGYGSGDEIVIAGATIPSNNGRYAVERVSGRDVMLDQTLQNETTPTSIATMLLSGDRYEFLELQNTGAVPLNLSGCYFSAGIGYAFVDGVVLEPGQMWLLTPHRSNLGERYSGLVANDHYMGSLDNGGERLTLKGPPGNVLFTVRYKDTPPWPLSADGFGFSLVPRDPGATGTQDNATLWRASQKAGGSPGAVDAAAMIPPVLINEVLAHSHPPQSDAIELWNSTASPVDLGGWFLSDDFSLPQKWRIPNGTTIDANGFLVFYEGHYEITTNVVAGPMEFGSAFSLSATGDEVCLFAPRLDYNHAFQFGASASDSSLGRYTTSDSVEHLVAQSQPTLGQPNGPPATGPVVITEVYFAPASNDVAFVELQNISNGSVPLFDVRFPTNTWKLHGLAFEGETPGLTLPPGGLLLLVASGANNVELWRSLHQIPSDIPILSYQGKLDEDGEHLKVMRPDEPTLSGTQPGTVPYIVMDEVRYGTQPPWPEVRAINRSLERLDPQVFGSEPMNWRASEAAGGTPGQPTVLPTTPLIAVHSTALHVSVTAGENPGLEELLVWNRGVGVLNYEIRSSSPLIKVTPARESSSGNSDRKVHYLEVSASQLPLGTHRFSLEIQAIESPLTPPIVVEAVVEVTPRPMSKIGFAPSEIVIRAHQGQNPQPIALNVHNAGTGTLQYEVASHSPWFTVTPAVGSALAGADIRSHSLVAHSSEMDAGTYVGWLSIHSTGTAQSQELVPVLLHVTEAQEFTAYNDLSWGAEQTTSNITTHTTSAGGGGSGGGPLIDYGTGLALDAQVYLIGGSWLGAAHAAQGEPAQAGTEADRVFNRMVDTHGVLSYATGDLILGFTNLNLALQYEFVLFGNRGSYPDRYTTIYLDGADSFVNRSGPGVEIVGNNREGTRVLNGSNTVAGAVVRYADIQPGADGTFRFRADAQADPRYYLNAFMLRGTIAGTPHLSLTPIDSDRVLLSWSGAGTLEQSSTPHGTWVPIAAETSMVVIEPSQPSAFFRLRTEQ